MEDLNIPLENNACVMTGLGKLQMEKRPQPADPEPYQ